jgi:hypothetical protein
LLQPHQASDLCGDRRKAIFSHKKPVRARIRSYDGLSPLWFGCDGSGFRQGSGGGIVGSGSPGTGSRFSGSGLVVFGQRSGEFGSHLENSASLWCWSCGIALSFQRYCFISTSG